MTNKFFLPSLLFILVSCSESFDIDVLSGSSDSAHQGIDNAFESTYVPMNSQPILFRSANIYDGIGGEYLNYDLLLSD